MSKEKLRGWELEITNSSNISKVSWLTPWAKEKPLSEIQNEQTGTLLIIYQNKKVYRYENVPRILWDKLVVAYAADESIGKWVNEHIKGKFEYGQL